MSLSRRHFIKHTSAAALLASLGSIREAAAQVSGYSPRLDAAEPGARAWSELYSLDPSITYLNHASIGTTPVFVQEAHRGYLELCETNPWLYMWSQPWVEPREVVRYKAARLLRCEAESLAITHNTTECFNLLAHGLPIDAGDEVLFSSLNHTGASLCWYHRAAEKGFTVRRFDFSLANISSITEDNIVDLYERALSPRTKVLVLPDVDNQVGLRHPVARIAEMARSHGVRWIAVDGAQTAGMIPMNVPSMGIDAYATSAHKWIQSPKELGLAYFSPEVQEDLHPMWVTWGQNYWKDTVRIFEDYGTRALPAVIALGDALDFQDRIPPGRREAHHRRLWNTMKEIVDTHDDLIWRSPTDWSLSAAVFAVEIRGKNSADVSGRIFEDHGIVVRAFSSDSLNALRISPNVANNEADLQTFVEAAIL